MKEPVHDWRTIREHWREDGRLQVERCRSCGAGSIMIADHETGAASIVAIIAYGFSLRSKRDKTN